MAGKSGNADRVRLGLVQMRVGRDTAAHLKATAARIGRAAARGAGIVCLPELFAHPYFPQWKPKGSAFMELAEPIPGPLDRFLSFCAARYGVVLVGGSIYERSRNGRLFNTALVYDAGGRRIGKYRKMHIPHDPRFWEQDYFAPGDLGYVQVPTGGPLIAPLICYDQWFPEPARINALAGAQILFYPTAIGWTAGMRRSEPTAAVRWQHAMRAHASMNGVFTVAVNRVGHEGALTFWGGSFVADPFGDVVARASSSRNQVLVADIDLRKIRESQDGWGFLANRRPESYRDLTR
jgi:N-carbamoylputrescine amidase